MTKKGQAQGSSDSSGIKYVVPKIDEFMNKFRDVKAMGFVQSLRRGPTGIGQTFNELMGLPEDNLAKPDIDGAEIKTHRANSGSMITLFTFDQKAWKMPPLEAINQYGSLDRNGRRGLYYTMSRTPNSAGLFLYIMDDEVSVRHISGRVIVAWNLDSIVDRFQKKFPSLLFVSAYSEGRDGIEYFHYYRVQLMKGTSPELLAEQFRAENILVDLRLHDNGTMARNHGTGFRTLEDKLPLLFSSIEDL